MCGICGAQGHGISFGYFGPVSVKHGLETVGNGLCIKYRLGYKIQTKLCRLGMKQTQTSIKRGLQDEYKVPIFPPSAHVQCIKGMIFSCP